MIFDILGAKKTPEQIEQERELERAWSQYGKEVEEFLRDSHLQGEFERLEKSKSAARPKVTLQVITDKNTPLSDDLKLRVKRGEIQGSKAYRFMIDPELKEMLEGKAFAPPQKPQLSVDLMIRVKRGEIQGSKAYRFMIDPELKEMLL